MSANTLLYIVELLSARRRTRRDAKSSSAVIQRDSVYEKLFVYSACKFVLKLNIENKKNILISTHIGD